MSLKQVHQKVEINQQLIKKIEELGIDLSKNPKQFENASVENHFLSKSFDYLSIGMAIITPEGTPIYLNSKICKMLGYSPDELKAKNVSEFTLLEDLYNDINEYKKVLKKESPGYCVEKRYSRKDGKVIRCEVCISAVEDEKGKVTYLLATRYFL